MWRLKVLIQFFLAHVPGGEMVNFHLQERAGSHSPTKIRERLVELVTDLGVVRQRMDLSGKTVVEVGTGWDAINPLLLALFGARPIHTYDHVRHVRFALVQRVLTVLDATLPEIARIADVPQEILCSRLSAWLDAHDLSAVFDAAGIVYRAPGDACRTELPDGSVDLFYSHAVLEHVPPEVLDCLTSEAKRVLNQGGLVFHLIGEGDHYTSVTPSLSRVNFLKYPEWLWRLLVQNKISYHNRLREKQFLDVFRAHGMRTEAIDSYIDDRDVETLQKMRIDRRFKGMTNEELAVNRTRVLLSFSGEAISAGGTPGLS